MDPDARARRRHRLRLGLIAGTSVAFDAAVVAGGLAGWMAGSGQGIGIVPGALVIAAFLAASVLAASVLVKVLLRRDETEQRRIEESLRLSDRMASVGTLASGIAHEINNPLAFVITNLAVVARELPILFPGHAGEEPWDDLLAAISDAREGADRVRTIVRDLRSFSRPESPEIVPVDLHACLDGAVSLAASEIRRRARLVKRYADPLPPALGNPGRLGQVFVSLLINAAQAIVSGDPEREEIRIVTRVAGEERVAVEIHDTGVGIPDDVRPRLFDPFFTTKPVGVGTGLGLSICHSIVTSLGGAIEVESEPKKGTIFRVLLPQAGSAAEFPATKAR